MLFTIPEKRLLYDRYFSIIRSDTTFFEIRSKNTGHYWIIKKMLSNTYKPIQVYHKHSYEVPYYHKHKSTISVNNAISIIMEHDKFVLNLFV